MTIQKKTLIVLFALCSFSLIIYSFNTFNVTPGQSYLSVLGSGTGDMSAGEFNLIDLKFLNFVATPLKMISSFVACLSVLVIILTYRIYRRHYKKQNLKYFGL